MDIYWLLGIKHVPLRVKDEGQMPSRQRGPSQCHHLQVCIPTGTTDTNISTGMTATDHSQVLGEAWG